MLAFSHKSTLHFYLEISLHVSLWYVVRFEHGHMTTWSQVLILYDEWWDLNMIIWPHSHIVMLSINWIISLLNYYVHLGTFSCIYAFRELIYIKIGIKSRCKHSHTTPPSTSTYNWISIYHFNLWSHDHTVTSAHAID